MKNRAWVAAAIALSSLTAQAAVTDMGILRQGINETQVTFSESPIAPGFFSEKLTFSLVGDSLVSGWITGFPIDVRTENVTVQRFSVTGSSPYITAKLAVQGNSIFFDLGTLQAPSGLSHYSGHYTMYIKGFNAPTATGVNLRMQVTAVPEASTWAMLAVGLAGVALVSRARRVSQA